jgi:tetraacyldisaccharide 4'-kinase
MAWPRGWHDALMAQWRRPSPGIGARCLQPLSWLYGLLSRLHAWLYEKGLLDVQASPRPVIVVGNLVAGGAGKTPAVMAIVLWLRAQGYKPGVISRGHGRSAAGTQLVGPQSLAAEVGDEPLLIRRRTGAPVAVGTDRAAAARLLSQRCPEVDVVVSDDGLQHHHLGRDVELLLFDDRGIGNGLLLPAGPLRQRLPAAADERRLVLYTNGRQNTRLPGFAGHRQLSGVIPLAQWWADPAGSRQPLSTLAGRPLLAVAGLARPEAFFEQLRAAGLTIRQQPLPDHDKFVRVPWQPDEADVIVTEKDAVKLDPERVGATRVWVATLDFEPEPAFYAALSRLLRPALR